MTGKPIGPDDVNLSLFFNTLQLMVFVAAIVGAGVSGCIGFSSEQCDPGEVCECDGVGNCERTCTGCDFECSGIGNCEMNSCTTGCTLTCENAGSCTLSDCTSDCELNCDGAVACFQD